MATTQTVGCWGIEVLRSLLMAHERVNESLRGGYDSIRAVRNRWHVFDVCS